MKRQRCRRSGGTVLQQPPAADSRKETTTLPALPGGTCTAVPFVHLRSRAVSAGSTIADPRQKAGPNPDRMAANRRSCRFCHLSLWQIAESWQSDAPAANDRTRFPLSRLRAALRQTLQVVSRSGDPAAFLPQCSRRHAPTRRLFSGPRGYGRAPDADSSETEYTPIPGRRLPAPCLHTASRRT